MLYLQKSKSKGADGGAFDPTLSLLIRRQCDEKHPICERMLLDCASNPILSLLTLMNYRMSEREQRMCLSTQSEDTESLT